MSRTPNLNRRNVLTLATGAAVIAGTGLSATNRALAKAPMLGAATAKFHRIKLGNFEITTISDGAVAVPKVHPIFGNNQSPEAVASYMAENFLPGDKMKIGFTPVIVNTGNEVILFDTGNGAVRRPNRGLLATSLAAAGFSPEQIDIVVVTHFHPDHIGGLIEGGSPAFPNARYVTAETEYNFWSKQDPADSNEKMAGRAKLVQAKVVPLAEKMTFIKDGADVVTGITSIQTFGHTPGHMAYNIESGGKRLVLWADACNHYVASLQKPEWHVVFDMDKDAAVASRKKILGMVAADKVPATGYHMPFPALGYVEAQGDAFRWVPVSYQL
ncbi:MAG: MBL fold metallo-hydrolase [Hyphomicrobiaceae bacterium]